MSGDRHVDSRSEIWELVARWMSEIELVGPGGKKIRSTSGDAGAGDLDVELELGRRS